jgi:hypothetical protein
MALLIFLDPLWLYLQDETNSLHNIVPLTPAMPICDAREFNPTNDNVETFQTLSIDVDHSSSSFHVRAHAIRAAAKDA